MNSSATTSVVVKICRIKCSRPASSILTSQLRVLSTSIPTRENVIKSIGDETFVDVLIVGGGATGAGAALDAATRSI